MTPENIEILNTLKLSYEEIAEITGRKKVNVWNQFNRRIPDWLKVAIYIAEDRNKKVAQSDSIIKQLQEDKKELLRLLNEIQEP